MGPPTGCCGVVHRSDRADRSLRYQQGRGADDHHHHHDDDDRGDAVADREGSDPNGGNKFTPGVKAPPAPTAIPGDN